MKRSTTLGLVLALLAARPVLGETFHVAQGHPDASDDNPGTRERPWKTLSRAAEALGPGDAACIHAGVYREEVRPARSGTAERPITYAAAEGEDVVITGADVVTGWEPVEGAVWKRAPWLSRFPTHPNDERHRLVGRCEQVIVDGRLLDQVAAVSEVNPGTFCALPEKKSLYLRLAEDADPNEHLVESSVRGLAFGVAWGREARDHICVRGLTIRYAANMAQRGALSAVGDGWSIEDCTVEWTNGTGLTFRGDDTRIRRVRSHHNGQQGASGGGKGFLLEEVVLDHNNWKGFDTDWEGGAIKITHARDGVVRRSRTEANRGNGFWFDIDVRDVVVEDCTARDNDGHGIFVEISGGFTIRNNVCARNGLDGRWGRGGIAIAESDSTTVEKNTCVLNPTGISIREQGPRTLRGIDGRQVSYHVHHLTIRRNISALNAKYQVGFWWDNRFFGPHPSSDGDAGSETYDPDLASIQLDQNLYWWTGDQRLALWGVPWRKGHQEYRKLGPWQTERGQDRGSAAADPKFVDPERGSWEIAPDSPAAAMKIGPQGNVPNPLE